MAAYRWSQRCDVCGRKPDTQPWPFQGFPCGHCDHYSMKAAGAPEHVLALAGDDPQLALDLKATGMDLALAAADIPPWPQLAREWIQARPAGTRLTSEDLIRALGLPRTDPGMNRNNAVGAAINGAARARLIRKTGQRVNGTRPESHGHEINLWERV